MDSSNNDMHSGATPTLSIGSRLGTGILYGGNSPKLTRTGSFNDLSISPFINMNSAKLSRRSRVQASDTQTTSHARTIIFGMINAGCLIPTMVGFASTIYKDKFFVDKQHNYLPQVVKLTFLSSAVHQLCFLLFSSLPFAVGQVQDAGLIFLASMAATIVHNMNEEDPDAVMATVVVSLSLSTLVLGLLLVITGKLKLAGLVQYLPLPVVGGYLAFIGLFCGLNGIRLTTGDDVDSLGTLKNVFNWHSVKLLLPGIAATLVLFVVSKKAKENQFALPVCMIAMPLLFFVIMVISGNSMQDARDAGWIAQKSETPVFYEVFEVFKFDKVDWKSAFPDILPTFIAMFLVVAFGSALDVAAIQFELGKPLDYDNELVIVGWSNVFSGMTGGYTGSYIFSQTIFTLRNGIESRFCGAVVAFFELLLFLLPIDLLSLLPRFFFGSVLLFVSIDLLLEWLVHSCFCLETKEYAQVWITFVFIVLWGLEAGMALGVVVSALFFVFAYSKSNQGRSIEVIEDTSSKAIRSYMDHKILRRYSGRVVALKLSGYHFFGTVISTILGVQSHVVVELSDNTEGISSTVSGDSSGSLRHRQQQRQQQPKVRSRSDVGAVDFDSAISTTSSQSPTVRQKRLGKLAVDCNATTTSSDGDKLVETRIVVLDMRAVAGIDATAARSCFLVILQSLKLHGITLIFAGLRPDLQQVLAANGVLKPPVVEPERPTDDYMALYELESPEDDQFALTFGSLDEAFQFTEEGLLNAVMRNEVHQQHSFFCTDVLRVIKTKYFRDITVHEGDAIFKRGDPATSFYVVEAGRVDRKDTHLSFAGGSIFGFNDFFVGPGMYQYTAVAVRLSTISCLTKQALQVMEDEEPELAVQLERALIKSILRN